MLDLRVTLFNSSLLCFVVSDFRLVSMWTVTYGRRLLQVKRPNQQYQSTEGTNSTQTNQTYNEQTWTQNTTSPLVYNNMGWLGDSSHTEGRVARPEQRWLPPARRTNRWLSVHHNSARPTWQHIIINFINAHLAAQTDVVVQYRLKLLKRFIDRKKDSWTALTWTVLSRHTVAVSAWS